VSAIPGTRVDHETEINELRERVAQLQTALDSRVAIEQAKGVLMERFSLTPDAAFELLRRAARSNRESLHTLAALVTVARTTPPEIVVLMTETERGRKAHNGSWR
jgi:AmiR/NasT family two-component response regulator